MLDEIHVSKPPQLVVKTTAPSERKWLVVVKFAEVVSLVLRQQIADEESQSVDFAALTFLNLSDALHLFTQLPELDWTDLECAASLDPFGDALAQ
jgi:hypothetical protein